MSLRPVLFALALSASALSLTAASSLVLLPPGGAAPRAQVVLLAGDEEYRSEEALPMLAKILSQRHGFKCTVLFPLDADGVINPNNVHSLADSEALDSADVIVMAVRFRAWPDADMERFMRAFNRGVPIVALRTSTHPFNFPGASRWSELSWNRKDGRFSGGFGKAVLGETWVSHWGDHQREATRGIAEPAAAGHPVLRGVTDVFGDSDVYEAYPPADATVLLRGEVVRDLGRSSPASTRIKTRATDKQTQPINDPMMPVAWTRVYRHETGIENRIVCTTLGAATDLTSAGLRRFVVNSVIWLAGQTVPPAAAVEPVDPYHPSPYRFNGFRIGLRPDDFRLRAEVPAGAQRLFDGLSLGGWHGDPKLWSVEDGAITGRTSDAAPIEQNAFLIWKGGVVRNFELRLQFRFRDVNGKRTANSGVQYRSRVLDAAKGIVGGYQADMDAAGRYVGMLYEERGRGILAKPGERVRLSPAPAGGKFAPEVLGATAGAEAVSGAFRLEDWNDLVITAVGNRLVHRINGVITAEITDLDPAAASSEGVIALQLHKGPAMTIQFRNVGLTPLP